MITITKLEQKTYQGKPQGYKVTLSDGTTGNLQEKESDKGLREGDPVSVTLSDYTSKAGNVSKLVTLKLIKGGSAPSAPQSQTPITSSAPNAPRKVSSAKEEATIKAMGYMVDAFIADKITFEQIREKHAELSGYLYDAIDEINA